MGAAPVVAANCWLAAASAFDLPAGLLYAIAEVESGMQSTAVAHAKNGTHSVGLMQINSSWFDHLQRFGISKAALAEPCTNIHAGAWILAGEVRRYGYSWEAIGAYYAGPFDVPGQHWRLKYYSGYANRVLAAWKRLRTRSGLGDAAR